MQLRLTITVCLGRDQGPPYRMFLGLHDVFHHRKSSTSSSTAYDVTLTSHSAGHGIILHVRYAKPPLNR